MEETRYGANCELVLEMEEAGVGVEEILQYAHGVLTDGEIHLLIRGLRDLAGVEHDRDEEEGRESREPSRTEKQDVLAVRR